MPRAYYFVISGSYSSPDTRGHCAVESEIINLALFFLLQEAEIVRKALMKRGLGRLGDQRAKIGTARAVPHVDWPAHPSRRSLQLPPRRPGTGMYNGTPGEWMTIVCTRGLRPQTGESEKESQQ